MSMTMSSVARVASEQMFAGLTAILEKGAAHGKAKKIDEAVLLNWRLAADMYPLTVQVQIATEIPARGLSRLAGVAIPSFTNDEKTFEDLYARIARVRTHIAGLPSAAVDADLNREIKVPMGPQERTFTRINFLQHFILPNMYFHTTAAYLILRHIGVEVGKMDFLAVSHAG